MTTTREQRNANSKAYRARWYNGIRTGAILTEGRPEIPPRVALDRDRRRYLVPKSTTAALMGDPLPGRSALDRT